MLLENCFLLRNIGEYLFFGPGVVGHLAPGHQRAWAQGGSIEVVPGKTTAQTGERRGDEKRGEMR